MNKKQLKRYLKKLGYSLVTFWKDDTEKGLSFSYVNVEGRVRYFVNRFGDSSEPAFPCCWLCEHRKKYCAGESTSFYKTGECPINFSYSPITIDEYLKDPKKYSMI